MDNINTEEICRIMGNCANSLSRSQYRNDNIRLLMQIFDEGRPLKTSYAWWTVCTSLTTVMLITLGKFTLRKMCKDLFSSVSMEDSKFPILLCSLTLVVFYRYMRSQKTEHVNTIKKKMYGTQPMKYEEGGRSYQELISEKSFNQSPPMMP